MPAIFWWSNCVYLYCLAIKHYAVKKTTCWNMLACFVCHSCLTNNVFKRILELPAFPITLYLFVSQRYPKSPLKTFQSFYHILCRMVPFSTLHVQVGLCYMVKGLGKANHHINYMASWGHPYKGLSSEVSCEGYC